MSSPGGTRRANNSGHVKRKPLSTGELRYQAYWRARYLGTFETLVAAEQAIQNVRGLEHAALEAP
jgi:hypothetical protein